MINTYDVLLRIAEEELGLPAILALLGVGYQHIHYWRGRGPRKAKYRKGLLEILVVLHKMRSVAWPEGLPEFEVLLSDVTLQHVDFSAIRAVHSGEWPLVGAAAQGALDGENGGQKAGNFDFVRSILDCYDKKQARSSVKSSKRVVPSDERERVGRPRARSEYRRNIEPSVGVIAEEVSFGEHERVPVKNSDYEKLSRREELPVGKHQRAGSSKMPARFWVVGDSMRLTSEFTSRLLGVDCALPGKRCAEIGLFTLGPWILSADGIEIVDAGGIGVRGFSNERFQRVFGEISVRRRLKAFLVVDVAVGLSEKLLGLAQSMRTMGADTVVVLDGVGVGKEQRFVEYYSKVLQAEGLTFRVLPSQPEGVLEEIRQWAHLDGVTLEAVKAVCRSDEALESRLRKIVEGAILKKFHHVDSGYAEGYDLDFDPWDLEEICGFVQEELGVSQKFPKAQVVVDTAYGNAAEEVPLKALVDAMVADIIGT